MPIVIYTPAPADPPVPFGPGMRVSFFSDYQGTLAPDAYWTVFMEWDLPGGHLGSGWQTSYHVDATSVAFRWWLDDDGPQLPLPPIEAEGAAAANAFLSVVLRDPRGIIDTGGVTVKPDFQTGMPMVVGARQQTQGGFTETDRQNLVLVQQSVIGSFPDTANAAANVSLPIVDLFTDPPVKLLTRAEHVQLSGSGTLTRPGFGVPVNAYGATFQWFTVPPHYGKSPGSTIEYVERLAQFTAVKRDGGGNEYIAEVVDAHWDGIVWSWGIPWPEYILYTIAPGVVVDWVWLEFWHPRRGR